ncbi:MAG: hypothetical protein E6269_05250, partial [Clostridiales bacterium]|nr:hypothetical protein [Clostridiales bacterium]
NNISIRTTVIVINLNDSLSLINKNINEDIIIEITIKIVTKTPLLNFNDLMSISSYTAILRLGIFNPNLSN